MKMNDYQIEAYKTAIYPKSAVPHYNGLAIAEEAGEICGKIKRYYRDNLPLEEVKKYIKKEGGDLLWELCGILTEFELTLEEVAEANLEKLRDRAARGVISGSGDNR